MLYTEVLEAIYGIIQSYILSYIKFRKYLKTGGFKLNPNGPCVSNNIIEGEPLTVVFHVDDINESNKDTKVADNFEQ